MSNLKSDQSVDSVVAHSVPAFSKRGWLETLRSQAERIIGSLNGRVGDTLVQQCSSPSPTPVISTLPRSKTDPWRRLRGRTSPRKTAPNKLYRVSRFLIPRSYSTPATFILVKSGLAGQILSTRTLSGLRIGGRLTNRPCMDSAEGDAIVRFRAPGSILIPSKFFHLGRDNFQPPLNRDPWKRQPRQRPSSQESPPL